MNTTNEKSLTKTADPVSVFIGDTLHTSSGSAAFDGLRKGGAVVTPEGQIIYVALMGQEAAEAKDCPPVAGPLDSTPTNWFELAKELCHGGHITETRRLRAEKAVREALL